jgi:hypothetical protein
MRRGSKLRGKPAWLAASGLTAAAIGLLAAAAVTRSPELLEYAFGSGAAAVVAVVDRSMGTRWYLPYQPATPWPFHVDGQPTPSGSTILEIEWREPPLEAQLVGLLDIACPGAALCLAEPSVTRVELARPGRAKVAEVPRLLEKLLPEWHERHGIVAVRFLEARR